MEMVLRSFPLFSFAPSKARPRPFRMKVSIQACRWKYFPSNPLCFPSEQKRNYFFNGVSCQTFLSSTPVNRGGYYKDIANCPSPLSYLVPISYGLFTFTDWHCKIRQKGLGFYLQPPSSKQGGGDAKKGESTKEGLII